MSRWADTLNQTAAVQSAVMMVVLADLDFVGGHVRVHDGLGPLSFGGNEYLGVGQFGGIELDPEDTDVSAKGARLTLSGIPNDLSPDILAETGYQRRAATVYLGLLDSDSLQWIGTPDVLFDGMMDYMDVRYGEKECRIVLHVEDELRREPIQAWYTDEDQQKRFSADRFFSDLPFVPNYRVTWGGTVIEVQGGMTRAKSGDPTPYIEHQESYR